MRTGHNLGYVRWLIGLSMVLVFLVGILPNIIFTPPQSSSVPTEQEKVALDGEPMEQEEVDLTTWEQLGGQGLLTHYNVDVWIPTSHAWLRHGDKDVTDALKSVTNNGTEMILSQRDNGNLHLLTKNELGEEFVVIINRITKSNDPYKNNHSALNTAWKLKDGATIGSYYDEQVLKAQRCILVRLRFDPGEVYFMPYR